MRPSWNLIFPTILMHSNNQQTLDPQTKFNIHHSSGRCQAHSQRCQIETLRGGNATPRSSPTVTSHSSAATGPSSQSAIGPTSISLTEGTPAAISFSRLVTKPPSSIVQPLVRVLSSPRAFLPFPNPHPFLRRASNDLRLTSFAVMWRWIDL